MKISSAEHLYVYTTRHVCSALCTVKCIMHGKVHYAWIKHSGSAAFSIALVKSPFHAFIETFKKKKVGVNKPLKVIHFNVMHGAGLASQLNQVA